MLCWDGGEASNLDVLQQLSCSDEMESGLFYLEEIGWN